MPYIRRLSSCDCVALRDAGSQKAPTRGDPTNKSMYDEKTGTSCRRLSNGEHKKPLIVLDRDGVINYDSADYIKSLNEWYPIPGSLEAIAKLCQAGWVVTIATNQSALSRGFTTLADVASIHQQLQTKLATLGGKIDAIALCPHLPEHHCLCRKPKPGLLLELAEAFGDQPQDLIVVGDSLRDIEAANAIGAKSYWVQSGKPLPATPTTNATIMQDLAQVADNLLRI